MLLRGGDTIAFFRKRSLFCVPLGIKSADEHRMLGTRVFQANVGDANTLWRRAIRISGERTSTERHVRQQRGWSVGATIISSVASL
jgi:hypothetical protein